MEGKLGILLAVALVLGLGAMYPAAAAQVFSPYLIFSEGDLTAATAHVQGDIYAGHNANLDDSVITGKVDYVNNLSVGAGGSVGSSNKILSLGSLPSNATIDALAAAACACTVNEIIGNLNFVDATPDGVYHLTGTASFASGAVGKWTIIADTQINDGGGGTVSVTSFIPATVDFPFGLALYSADGSVTADGDNTLGGNTFGLVAGASVNLQTNSDYNGGTTVPEPSSLLLLGSGLVGVGAAVRRKVKQFIG